MELDLSGTYRLENTERDVREEITLPGDVHSALLAAGRIPDPYFRDNERAVMWVSDVPWTLAREFSVAADYLDKYLTLCLSEVDCIATIYLNGEKLADVDNQFVRHDLDVTGKVRAGENSLRIEFGVARDVARARYEAHPFEIPYIAQNQPHMAHINFIRKSACHGGWDWGICLMPVGVYGTIMLKASRVARLDSVQVSQVHSDGACELVITTRATGFVAGEVDLSHQIDSQTIGGLRPVVVGENVFVDRIKITTPKLWWPAGQGPQPLYDLLTEFDGAETRRRVGLRDLEWVVEKDEIDHSFKCRVNGRDISMMGANWIPADALPSRITSEAVRDLLESAVAAKMNMIRVWGGGQYEPDYFYDLCDELGILVWQDFMFSCMPYPADPATLESVRVEVTQQVRRIQHHACVAIWCGDNEVISTFNLFPETRANRDRFVANYDRLSSLLASIVVAEDGDRRFWPSSPSLGYLDFSDEGHVDTRGDMHYWDVWHSAKPFEAYRGVNPRFASEFGFQSFPSMNVIDSFTDAGDRNPSAPIMESHQRNEGGNARILETMCRYFRFPKNFEQMVFLSQIQQGLAIKTAVEYWRSTKPRCMGTLYWQINDTWPVASWSSLDYGGQWKPLHAMAKKFYAQTLVVALPDPAGAGVLIKAINDGPSAREVRISAQVVGLNGEIRDLFTKDVLLETACAVNVATVALADLGDDAFLSLRWTKKSGEELGRNEYFAKAFKYFELPEPNIRATWQVSDGGPVLTVSSDRLAFFVCLESDVAGYFSDNAFTLFPGEERSVRFIARLGAEATMETLQTGLRVRSLRDTY